jgi:tetratricopeptide (TPR) repeat protein
MRGVSGGLRPVHILIIITLVIFFWAVASNWTAATEEEICDVRADQALRLENYTIAIALHRNFLRLHAENALGHYHLGFAYGMTGRATEEIGEYLEAARLGLHKWDLFLNLGLVYLDHNELPKATSALETAVILGPDHPEGHFNLAIAYERGKRFPEALREISVSLRLAPEDPDEHNIKAIIWVEMGDFLSARDEWAHLVQVSP